jgi:UDP-glucose 4-epimerase
MMSKEKRIIILGHSGFIGSHLSRFLAQSASKEIIGLSLPDVDLTDIDRAAELIPLLTPDSSIVLAAAVKRQLGDTLQIFQKNMAIAENICQLITEHPVKRIIFLSSAAVYGEETENLTISEQTPVNPTSFYGIAKYSAERLLMKVCQDNQKTSWVCLRPPLVYGLEAKGQNYGPSGFCHAALEGKPIVLWGDGSELREFIYVKDLCHAIAHLLNIEFSGELNAVSGDRYCFADIIAILKVKFPHLQVSSRPRSRSKANNAFDPQKIKSLLPPDFQFTSLEKGLSQLIAVAKISQP